MRFKTKQVELEAVKYDGHSIPEFADGQTSANDENGTLSVETAEGQKNCSIGEYLVLTDSGLLLVRSSELFEDVFEPVD
jgi:hypothetical protein